MSAPPVTATAIVQRLAHGDISRPSLLSRILGLVPKSPVKSRAQKPARLASRKVSPMAFAIYAGHATPIVYKAADQGLGIRAGSWIRVQLRHGITDSDSALVVLHVLFPVTGLSGSLPPGTRLLAHVQGANANRVQLSVSQAITPDDHSTPLTAIVFDSQFHLGLSGFVMGGRREAALMAFGGSLLASVDAALGMMGAQSSLASQTLSRAGRSTLRAAAPWGPMRHILYVPAQRAYVQLQKGS